MKIELYKVNHLLLDSSTYIGNLGSPKLMEMNVDLNNLRSVRLLLPSKSDHYNYIKIYDVDIYYYFILDRYNYVNGNQVELTYKIDIIRTLKEQFNQNNIDVRLTKYSNKLTLKDVKEDAYFWKNQNIKLGSDVFNSIDSVGLDINKPDAVVDYLNDTKWIYIWLQPKDYEVDETTGVSYQYKLTERISTTNDVTDADISHETAWRSLYGKEWKLMNNNQVVLWPDQYVVGQIYYTTDTKKYYKFIEYISGSGSTKKYYRRFDLLDNYKNDSTWFIKDLNPVTNQYLPSSAYCVVLPTKDIYVYKRGGSMKLWSANQFLNMVLNGDKDNSWLPYIIDMQISNMPPIDMTELDIVSEFGYITINSTVDGLQGFHGKTLHYKGDKAQGDYYFIPGLTHKLNTLLKYKSDFSLNNKITEQSLIYNKYYLAMFENRVELDIPLLLNDKALDLYLYEDVQPGRSTILLGYAPKENTLEYLIHSASTLTIDRDLSLPIFTSNYEQYISSNKNFVKQAELSRDTQLQQGLVNSGSQVLGSAAVSLSLGDGYNPANSMIRAAGGAVNTLIAFNAQKKQFNWSLDNMKSSPGGYKSASATTSIILTLTQSGYWIENYTSSDFDIRLYDDMISEIGYDYFDMKFKLKDVFENMYMINKKDRGFIQGRLTGIDFGDLKLTTLGYILNEELNKGVNIYL